MSNPKFNPQAIMQNLQKAVKKSLPEIKVKMTDEFDKNFSRRSFFSDKKWPHAKNEERGTLLQRSGRLRNSLKAQVQGSSIVFSTDAPYAKLHNEGGEITVTEKMRRYFMARFIQASKQKKATEAGF